MAFDPTPGFNLGATHALTSLFSNSNTDPNRAAVNSGNTAILNNSLSNLAKLHNTIGPAGQAASVTNDPYTGGGAASGTGSGNVADIATYTDNISALNGLLGQSDVNRQQGETGINNSFNRSNAQLNDQQTGTENKFKNQQTDTTKGYNSNLSTIDNQARNGYQSLQALLGGSGSAGDILAPMAVANDTGSKTNTARDSFAHNLQELDTARTDSRKQYKTAQDDLLGQKNSKLQSLIQSIDQQKQNYLGQIGAQENQLRIAQGGNYETPTAQNAAIAQLQSEQNGLADQYKQPAFTPQNVNVSAPNLSQYSAQAAQIGGLSNQNQGSAPTDAAAALQALLKPDDKQFNPYGV